MKIKDFFVKSLFASKWLLLIFYYGLVIAQGIYCYKFVLEVWDLIWTFRSFSEQEIMLAVLSLIDIIMVANLIKMIISGSYQTFIEPIKDDKSEKVTSGDLKVKMGMSLIGISSIHLLQTFMNVGGDAKTVEDDRTIIIKCSIHMIFLLSTIGLAIINHLHHSHKERESDDHKTGEHGKDEHSKK